MTDKFKQHLLAKSEEHLATTRKTREQMKSQYENTIAKLDAEIAEIEKLIAEIRAS